MMKMFCLLLLTLVTVGCSDSPTVPRPPRPDDTVTDPYAHLRLDTFDCPVPVGGPFPRVPPVYHTRPQLSPDGTKIAFIREGAGIVRVLNLVTGVDQQIDFQTRLPANVRSLGCDYVYWCPYDNNRLLIHCVTSTDTNGDGRGDAAGINIYILSIVGAECTRVTPRAFGPYGDYAGLHIYAWLPGSTPGNDSLLGGYAYPGIPDLRDPIRVYIPQRDTLVRTERKGWFLLGREGRDLLEVFSEGYPTRTRFLLNGSAFTLPDSLQASGRMSFSPDGTLLAIAVTRALDSNETNPTGEWWEKIAIIDVVQLLRERPAIASVQIIDFRQRFCTYSMRTITPEFITNRTLAVSMHKDGDTESYLWEITTDGRRVRQLTFRP